MSYVVKVLASQKIEACRCEGDPIPLRTLQGFVGGKIEALAVPKPYWMDEGDDLILIVNEEGWLEGLPYNGMASMLAEESSQYLVSGDAVLVCGRGENLIGLTQDCADRIVKILNSIISGATEQ